jgi:uncharacterized membrane protein
VTSIIESIEIQVPARTAYNQWTQFEQFPKFMKGVERVNQLDDRTIRWRAALGGKTLEWDARITEQIPDKRIAWTSTSGARNAGVVTFHRLSDHRCRVTLQLDYEPEGFAESVGDLLGVLSGRAKGDLEAFQEFIEQRGVETGGWRGAIASPDESRRG